MESLDFLDEIEIKIGDDNFFGLVDRIKECRVVKDLNRLPSFKEDLAEQLETVIPASYEFDQKMEADRILRICLKHQHGLKKLFKLLEYHDKHSFSFLEFKLFLFKVYLISKLFSHLEQIQWEKQTLQEVFKIAAPHNSDDFKLPSPTLEWKFTLFEMLQMLARANIQRSESRLFPVPLLEFAERLIIYPSATEIRRDIRTVVDKAIHYFGIEVEKLQELRNDLEHIQDRSLSEQDVGVPRLLMLISLYTSSRSSPIKKVRIRARLNNQGEEREIYPEEVTYLKNLAEKLNQILELVADELSINEQKNLLIEFFLPRQLLLYEVEQLKVDPQGWGIAVPVGRIYKVVVRPIERSCYPPEITKSSHQKRVWDSWYQKWNWVSVQSELNDTVKKPTFWVCNDVKLKVEDLPVWMADLNVLCLILIPPISVELSQEKLLELFTNTGTPIALWYRKDSESLDACKELIKSILYKRKLSELPYTVYKLRKGEPHSSYQADPVITLIWDDPTKLPQDVNTSHYFAPPKRMITK